MDFRGGRFLIAAVGLAFAVVSCGSGTSMRPKTVGEATSARRVAGEDSPYWVAGVLPKGFRPLLVEELDDHDRIFYGTLGQVGDVDDADLRLLMAPEDRRFATETPAERVVVRGRDGFVVPLSGDGKTYGVMVTWEQAPGLWLTVEGIQPVSRAQVLDVAEGVEPVGGEEWARLREALSIDTRVGRVGADPTEVELITGTVAGGTYTLTVLVPKGFPLGPEDLRRNCFRVTFRGEISDDFCDGPRWLRMSGQVFAAGPASVDATELVIRPYLNRDGEATVTEATRLGSGPPSTFYLVPLPEGSCFVEVTHTDGRGDDHLGMAGPPRGQLPGLIDDEVCQEQARRDPDRK